jgi:hypothetical protein
MIFFIYFWDYKHTLIEIYSGEAATAELEYFL